MYNPKVVHYHPFFCWCILDRGVAVVRPGQIVYGGEVLHKDRQYSFDYISNIEKRISSNDGAYALIGQNNKNIFDSLILL